MVGPEQTDSVLTRCCSLCWTLWLIPHSSVVVAPAVTAASISRTSVGFLGNSDCTKPKYYTPHKTPIWTWRFERPCSFSKDSFSGFLLFCRGASQIPRILDHSRAPLEKKTLDEVAEVIPIYIVCATKWSFCKYCKPIRYMALGLAIWWLWFPDVHVIFWPVQITNPSTPTKRSKSGMEYEKEGYCKDFLVGTGHWLSVVMAPLPQPQQQQQQQQQRPQPTTNNQQTTNNKQQTTNKEN